MAALRFSWDPTKSRSNRRKHGVTFEEAASVFLDENAIEFYDDGHSGLEDRFLLLGMRSKPRLLIVCHCMIDEDTIRILSARRATRRESLHYGRR